MKICHVSYSTRGGAGIAAGRLHRALSAHGVAADFLAVLTFDGDGAEPLCSRWRFGLMRLAQHFAYRSYKLAKSANYSGHGFELFPMGLRDAIEARGVDIVHLHGIAGEMLSIGEIGALCRSRPVVWTFHDAWPYTGTEQYVVPGSAPRYRDGYRADNYEGRGWDLDRWYWQRKYRCWHDMPCRIVAPSEYLAAQIRESLIFKDHVVTVIPHGLDLWSYSPGDRSAACRNLGIDEGRRYVGAAMVDVANRVKGGDLLAEFLNTGRLAAGGYTLLVAGRNCPAEWEKRGDVCCLGELAEPRMRDFFRAVELFFNPTRMESFGLTNLEAMACGTPVLSTCQSAMPEVVSHLSAGYLAQPESLADFLTGFEYIVSYRARLAAAATERVRSHFSADLMADRYIQLYREVLSSNSAGKA